jgi:hypothetical protein
MGQQGVALPFDELAVFVGKALIFASPHSI